MEKKPAEVDRFVTREAKREREASGNAGVE